MKSPKTPKKEVKEVLHGVEISDNYRWLEDVDSAETQTWLDQQDQYSRSILDGLPKREELRSEFEKLFRQDTLGFPHPRNGRYFFMKRLAGQDLSVLYVKEGLRGEPKVLVDPNKISQEKGFPVSLTEYSISKDEKLITYSLSEAHNDQSNLYVMDVNTCEHLSDVIPGEFYPHAHSWAVGSDGFWYGRRKIDAPKGEEKFHRKLYYHKLGRDFSKDELVFGEQLAKEDRAGASATRDGQYLLISVEIQSEPYSRSEIYLFELKSPEKGFQPVIKEVKGNTDIQFGASIHRGYVYIVTNYRASKYKIQRVAVADITKGMSVWETIIPENAGKVVESYSLVQDKLFITTLEDVHSTIREYTLEGSLKREVELPTLGSVSSVVAEPEGDEAFFSFNSFAYPDVIFRIDLTNDQISVFDRQKVDVDVSNIEAKQIWYRSKDGTKIPMFLVYKKDLELNGCNPTLLYGYGGFNITLTPGFTKSIIPFVERGGIYAVANLRGGGEFGEEWHQAGTKKQKQNVFDDFVAAAEWLISNNYTDHNHLAVEGGSNGGLLVGVVMTQRPELIKVVIMAVPVADMLRYHLFHGGRYWIPDYGSAEDPDMFPYLLSYSPYHNVKDGAKYPATMIVTSDKDDRVHPGQAFKMLARLQEANISNNPILLQVERKAGHSGAADISRFINKAVDKWSFLFQQLNVE